MRAAIYVTPPADHPLTAAAEEWIGRSAFDGGAPARGPSAQSRWFDAAAITAEPRRYGFHATLRAPFRLAEGATLADLDLALALFASQREPITVPALRLERIGPFFALTADGASEAVDRLAGEAVRHFEPFRAALSEAELGRRRMARLDAREEELLLRYGYPYVCDRFRFHMSLTGPVSDEAAVAVEAELGRRFAPFIRSPLGFDALALFVEPEPGSDFRVHALHPFGAKGDR